MQLRGFGIEHVPDIWRRLEVCEIAARGCGWHPAEIALFAQAVREAFSYEEAMAIVHRDFDVTGAS